MTERSVWMLSGPIGSFITFQVISADDDGRVIMQILGGHGPPPLVLEPRSELRFTFENKRIVLRVFPPVSCDEALALLEETR